MYSVVPQSESLSHPSLNGPLSTASSINGPIALNHPTAKRKYRTFVMVLSISLLFGILVINNGKNTMSGENIQDIPAVRSSDEQVSKLKETCPNWSHEFASRFEAECGDFWLQKFQEYDRTIGKNSKEAVYWCENQDDCRGWGDRLGGILNAFMKALHGNMQFKVAHEGLASLFSPCLFTTKYSNWAAQANPRLYYGVKDTCLTGTALQCGGWLSYTCGMTSLVTKNTDRTCMPEHYCQTLLDLNPSMSAAKALGCGLRAILEPSARLYHQVKFPIKFGRQSKRMMSLKEIEDEIRTKYYVISIHFRLGDVYSFFGSPKAREISLDVEKFARPFRCAETLESHFAGLNEQTPDDVNITVDGKPIMWFIATDSLRLKNFVETRYHDKVIALEMRPEHIAMHNSNENLMRTIAEWYVLGLGNQLILNKIGPSSSRGDFYSGRVSAFSKTSWVYQLKHLVYEAGKCLQYSLPFEGIWDDLKLKSCGKSLLYKGKTVFPQEHLQRLTLRNLTFPHAYVEKGKVILNEVETLPPVSDEDVSSADGGEMGEEEEEGP
jgi:hypothetical protein